MASGAWGALRPLQTMIRRVILLTDKLVSFPVLGQYTHLPWRYSYSRRSRISAGMVSSWFMGCLMRRQTWVNYL